MAVIGELLVLVGVNNAGLTAGLAKSEAELKGFGSTTTSLASKAMLPLAAIGIASGVVGFEAIKSASAFQTSMELIKTQAGGTQAEVDAMTQGILAMAPAVGIGPLALSEGLFHLESAGFRGADALGILTIAAEGAKVGHADLEEVTNALNAAVVSGIPGVQSMSGAMGSLNAIVGAGDMRMSDLVEALGTGVLAAVKAFGLSLNDVGAALATFGDNNIRGADAATALRLSVQFLAKGTANTDTALAKIGLSSRQLRDDLATGGLTGALTDLHDHLDAAGISGTGIGNILLDAFGKKAGVGLSILIGQYDRYMQKSGEIAAGADQFGQAWEATSHLISTKSDQIAASIETVTDAIGIGLIPTVQNLSATILPVVTDMSSWAVANPGTASSIVGVGVAIGGLTLGVKLATIAVGTLRGAFFGLAGAGVLGGLAAGAGIVVGLKESGAIDWIKTQLNTALFGAKTAGEIATTESSVTDNMNAGKTIGAFEPGGIFGGPLHPGVGPPTTFATATLIPQPGDPAGRFAGLTRGPGGGSIVLNHTTNVHLDGALIAQSVDQRLYDRSAVYSSGFASDERPRQ